MTVFEYKYIGYVGCYTLPHQADPFKRSLGGVPHDDSKVGKGILAIGISNNGKFSYLSKGPVVPAYSVSNPSYLAIIDGSDDDDQSRRLCVVSEMDEGKVFVFSVDQNDPTKLSQIGSALPSGGSTACHVTEIETTTTTITHNNNKDKYIVVSNYGRENDNAGVSMYRIGGKNGTEISMVNSISYSGQGSYGDLSRQMSSHTHSCAGCSSVAGEMFTADLGTDSIIRFTLNDDSGIEETGKLALPRGSGPRSIVFQRNPSSSQDHIGVVSLELTAQVLLLQRRSHDGCLEALGSPVSILPPDWPEDDNRYLRHFNNGKWASDVVWSQNGKYIFAAARLHNSISVFELIQQRLQFIRRISTGGKTPRCLCVSPGGEFLLVAHQHSHDVSSFQIDESTGMLVFADKIETPLAACIKMF